jgi:hypothetical protein
MPARFSRLFHWTLHRPERFHIGDEDPHRIVTQLCLPVKDEGEFDLRQAQGDRKISLRMGVEFRL